MSLSLERVSDQSIPIAIDTKKHGVVYWTSKQELKKHKKPPAIVGCGVCQCGKCSDECPGGCCKDHPRPSTAMSWRSAFQGRHTDPRVRQQSAYIAQMRHKKMQMERLRQMR